MATRDWASLGFTPTLSFALPTERQLAQSSQADASKGAEFKFNPTQLNAQLLASLGYTRQGLTDTAGSDYGFGAGPQWSDDARTWLANQGYTVGVAHDPNTSPGGRPEYYGLVDRNGQFVAGQDDPTMTMSDTLMEQITPFLMLAGPFSSAISTSQALAAAGASGAGSLGSAASGLPGAGAGSVSGGLGGVADGVTALGSSMSPSSLGISAVAPSVSSAEIAALGSGIPSLTPSLTDLALQGAMRGAVTGGVKGLVTGQNPLQTALQGAIGGGISGGITGGVNALNPDGAGWVNSGITGGIKSAIGGGNPLMGAIGGAAGPLFNSGMSSLTQPATTTGGNMGLGDWFSDWNPDSVNFTTDITGNVLPVDLPTFSGGGAWNPDYGNWVSDWASGLFSGSDGAGGSGGWGSAILNGLKGAIGSASDAVGGGKNLAGLVGAGIGALSGGGTETSTRRTVMDPRFDPYVFGSGIGDDTSILGHARNMWMANPSGINPTMQQGLDMQKAALTDPAYGQAYQQMRNVGMGLLGGGVAANPFTAQQPTMSQAGGAGGLLGGSAQDRMKALMTRGQGLVG
jgi:hypothetical protein